MPLHAVDLFPAFAELAGADTEAGLPLDGLDAWEAIAEGADSPRDEVVFPLGVIRKGDWKLIERGVRYCRWESDSDKLYNIREDPHESTNLAESDPDKVDELRACLHDHVQEWFSFPSPGPFERIPGHPPTAYGANEQAPFGPEVKRTLRLLAQGDPGPSLAHSEVSGGGVRLA